MGQSHGPDDDVQLSWVNCVTPRPITAHLTLLVRVANGPETGLPDFSRVSLDGLAAGYW